MKLAIYTAKTIITSILIVLMVFFFLFLFVALLSEFNDIGQGHYGIVQAIYFVLGSTPLNVYTIFPSIVLIGVLLGLGSLATHNELMIYRTSGLSLVKIAIIILLTALLVTVVMTGIGEGVAPRLARYVQNEKTMSENNGQVISTLSGVWVRKGNNFFHIAMVDSSSKLEDVTYFQFNTNYQLLRANQASTGEKINGRWEFRNIHTSVFNKDNVQQLQQEVAYWPLDFNLRLATNTNPTVLSLTELYNQIKFTKITGGNSNNLQLTFWTRIFQPLTTLIMVLVAIPFIFGPLRSVSLGLRLLSGIMIGLVFFILNRFLVSFGMAYQLPPVSAALMLPLLFLAFSVFLFRYKS